MRQDLYYSVSEAAAALNVSKMTVYRHIHTGRLDAIRVGTSYRVSATSLERITTIARDLASLTRWPAPPSGWRPGGRA